MEASLYMYVLWVLTGYFFQCVSSQAVTLSSSLNDQNEVRRGEIVTFNCSTIGSSVLAWNSSEYIGDDPVQFLADDPINRQIVPTNFSSAQLIDTYDDTNGRKVLVSQFQIIVQNNLPDFSVSCQHENGKASTLIYMLSDTPLLIFSGGNMCPGEFQSITCEIRDSSILAWESDEYIGSRFEFLFFEPVGTVKFSEINSGVFATLTANYVQNGVRVLRCQLNISELIDDVEVTCVNVGIGTRNSYDGNTVNYNCDPTQTDDNPLATKRSTTNGATSINKNGTSVSFCWLFVWFLVFSMYFRYYNMLLDVIRDEW